MLRNIGNCVGVCGVSTEGERKGYGGKSLRKGKVFEAWNEIVRE